MVGMLSATTPIAPRDPQLTPGRRTQAGTLAAHLHELPQHVVVGAAGEAHFAGEDLENGDGRGPHVHRAVERQAEDYMVRGGSIVYGG